MRLTCPRLPQSAPIACRRRSLPSVTRSMFTGIVQGTATVASVVTPSPGVAALTLRFPGGALANVPLGGSIAVNGTCLTVVSVDGDAARFDVVDETLRVTTLGGLAEGDAVNYERSARVGDEIGGHVVSGHVATKATVIDVQRQADGNTSITFDVPAPWGKYILPKGFIAVHGVSLTVGAVTKTGDPTTAAAQFTVHLIPETLRVTVLGRLATGDAVNIEVDATTQAVVAAVEAVVGDRLAGLVDARVEEVVRRLVVK